MPHFKSTPHYEHGVPESLGVLVVNLGTPDAPTTAAVRRYLAEFLSDPRVVEVPRALWWFVLHGYILRFRPARSAAAYQKIWTKHGSPLLLHTQSIAHGVQEVLAEKLGCSIPVEVGMSYGQPSIASAMQRLFDRNVTRMLILPLYPQYSGTTTGSVYAAVSAELGRRRWVPESRFINHYHDAPGYIDALAASVREHWQAQGRGEKLLMSFHGVPERTLHDGDPYHCQCWKTGRLLANALELAADEWMLTFQSRVGREVWLKPYTDEVIAQLGSRKTASIDVICPGFSADCLETLEEIEMQNAELFVENGGGALRYIPALNNRADHIEFLGQHIAENVGGWPEGNSGQAREDQDQQRRLSRDLALGMGAKR